MAENNDTRNASAPEAPKAERPLRGSEEGIVVDGVFLGWDEVIRLAEMPLAKHKQWLASRCVDNGKACKAVGSYMAALRVSLDQLIRYLERGVAS